MPLSKKSKPNPTPPNQTKPNEQQKFIKLTNTAKKKKK